MSNAPILARRPSLLNGRKRWIRSNRALLGEVILILILLLTIGLVIYYFLTRLSTDIQHPFGLMTRVPDVLGFLRTG